MIVRLHGLYTVKYAMLLAIAFSWASAYGRIKGGSIAINLSHTTQYYFETGNVKFDAQLPQKHLYANNTYGQSIAVQIERVTRDGLILSLGLGYGVRRYDIDYKKDFTNFDPDAVDNLKQKTFSQNFSETVNYLKPRLMVGYQCSVGRNWIAGFKAGLSEMLFFDGIWDNYSANTQYETDDGSISKNVQFMYAERYFGRQDVIKGSGKLLQVKLFPQKILLYEFYAGISREFDKPWIRNVSIGIEGTRGVRMWDNIAAMSVQSSQTIDKGLESEEVYLDRNISLGVRLSVGIWR